MNKAACPHPKRLSAYPHLQLGWSSNEVVCYPSAANGMGHVPLEGERCSWDSRELSDLVRMGCKV